MVKMSGAGLCSEQDIGNVQYQWEAIPAVVLGMFSEGEKFCHLKEKQSILSLIVVLETRLVF